MHDFDIDAERIKLERLLNVEDGALAFISSMHSSRVRAFREHVSDLIYQRHQDNYARLARLSRVLPTGASAKLAETVLGSVLGAGVAGEMDPERAGKLASKLSPRFLAKLSIHLEPHRATRIIGEIPVQVLVDVARELVAREEFITLARFVTAVDSNTLKAVMDAIDSADALLRVGIFVEARDRLDALLEQLSDERRRDVLQAATDADMWPQTMVLMTHLSDRMKGVMGDVTVSLGDDLMTKVIDIAHDHNLWEPLLLSVANMQPENRRKALSLAPLHDADTVQGLLQEIDNEHLWALLTHLWLDADDETLACAISVLIGRHDWIADLLREAHASGRAAELKQVLARLPASLAQSFADIAGRECSDDFAAVMA